MKVISKNMSGRWGTHYESIPHSDCGDPRNCDCECPGCMAAWIKANNPIPLTVQRSLFSNEIQARFEKFHAENPIVYKTLVERARTAKAKGFSSYSIKAIYEVVRWELGVMNGVEEFKLPNDYTSRYARLIMATESDLRAYFETRELKRV